MRASTPFPPPPSGFFGSGLRKPAALLLALAGALAAFAPPARAHGYLPRDGTTPAREPVTGSTSMLLVHLGVAIPFGA